MTAFYSEKGSLALTGLEPDGGLTLHSECCTQAWL
jgi:hypothetical protein